jgi:ATP-binding cassette subfamily C (CFTR/MRP) protein 1
MRKSLIFLFSLFISYGEFAVLFLYFSSLYSSRHGPVLSLVVAIIFIFEVGYAPALAGMTFLWCLFPLQNMVARRIGRLRQKMIKLTDERVKLINEMLQSIRVIKLYAWEDPLEKRVEKVRNAETAYLLSYLGASGHLRELIFSAQPVAAMIIFVTATFAMDKPLSLPQIFRIIAFLNITRFPLNLLGQAMKNVTDGMVSVRRLNRFFLLPTLRNTQGREFSHHPKVQLANADFAWQDIKDDGEEVEGNVKEKNATETEVSTEKEERVKLEEGKKGMETGSAKLSYFKLSDLSFETMKENELIAIIGPVGCGKSSFMSALLGEMICKRGKSVINGTLSFCAQTPWIQNITLKQNILFEVDPETISPQMFHLYQQSIEAAALLPDLKILPAGDMTESKQHCFVLFCFLCDILCSSLLCSSLVISR